MPRRNNRQRPHPLREGERSDLTADSAPETYEQMAQSLVRRGLASRNILDRSARPHTQRDDS